MAEEIEELKTELDRLKEENRKLADKCDKFELEHEFMKNQLFKAREEAQSANRAKANFLANMSHEIRTPMNAITGMSEFIIRDCKDKQAVDNAKMINNAAKSLVTIINDILDYSKVIAGDMEIKNGACDTATLINDVSSMIEIKLSERPVKFNVEADEDIPKEVFADTVRVKQVLINILNNACKFTKEGNISFRVACQKNDEDSTNITFQISDTGVGIKEENVSKIFNLFEQVDTKKNRMEEGTGLGLAICKQLVELMDGMLKIESVFGQGTTVTIMLPCKVKDWTPVGDIKANVISINGKDEKKFTVKNPVMLVVDDNKINIKVAAGIMKQFGIVPDTALSGLEAIEKVKSKKYDIVFMDHMMPGMDGVEALGEIRKIPGLEEQIVIALTANVTSGVREEYLRLGFQEFLAKPIDRNELAKILKKYIAPERLIKEGAINIALLMR